jgi:glyoxylase-like metal-dependent hydrolase (beta-lactamase superfamily II)
MINNPSQSIDLLIKRINELWNNYISISSINHHFPQLFKETMTKSSRMEVSRLVKYPNFVKPLPSTSMMIQSKDKSVLLIDCGQDSVIKQLKKQLKKKKILSIDGCWITHYHDDHVDSLEKLVTETNCMILAEEHQADILENPIKYFLPCISPTHVKVTKIVKDRESWNWKEFKLTSFFFPGQTYYHGGLLVEGHGSKVFIAGDSFGPTGIDDYCSPNRNFTHEKSGLHRCLDILEEFKPDFIINQHIPKSFSFTTPQLKYMHDQLVARNDLLSELLPWPDPNFGTDEYWVRTYPYEQYTNPDSQITIEIQFTNHADINIPVKVEPVLPALWKWINTNKNSKLLPPCTIGVVNTTMGNSDVSIKLIIHVPKGIFPQKVIIPIRLFFNNQYLGQFRHAIVNIIKKQDK